MMVPKRLMPILLLTLVVPVIFGSVVLAQSTTATDSETSTQTREERLTERKTRLKTRLTTAQQTRLRGRCEAAQVITKQFHGRVTSMENNRKSAHKKIVDQLNAIVAKIGDKADTTQLESAIATLKTKTDALDASLVDYKQAVTDLSEMDCKADPAAFQATLSDLRTQRADLATASTDIRTYVKETIKPILKAIKTELDDKKDTN